jgi:uncharacterized membrane protein
VETKQEQARETARIESFSDGVFAIAATLLILDIHVPDVGPNASLLRGLLNEWPSMLALLIGFFTLLICWINHHYMFQHIYRSDSMLLLLNGFKLLIVTITPIATAILSKFIGTDHERAAVALYCFNFALMGTAMTALYTYACRKGYVRGFSEKGLLASWRLYIFASIYSTVIFIVSLMSIVAALALFVIMFFIFLSPKHMVAWQAGRMEYRVNTQATMKDKSRG